MASKGKIVLGVAGVVTGVSAAIFIGIKIRNSSVDKKLEQILGGGVGQYGDLKDMPGFKGKVYRDGLASNLNIIKLKDEVARNYADNIDKAWGVLNDDEPAVYSVFNNIKDNYALSQVASVYEVIYKVPLLTKLEDKLSSDEQNEVYKIVRLYKPYRIAS